MKAEDAKRADDLFDLAEEWLTQNELNKAIASLTEVIEINPNFIYAYITLAEALKRKKSYQLAIKTLKDAIFLDPDFSKLYFLIAEIEFLNKNKAKALEYIDLAIAKDELEEYFSLKEKINS